jgi:hypothetical protein
VPPRPSHSVVGLGGCITTIASRLALFGCIDWLSASEIGTLVSREVTALYCFALGRRDDS